MFRPLTRRRVWLLSPVLALVVAGCGTPGPLPSATPAVVGNVGPVETESPAVYPHVAGIPAATPYPLACATWLLPAPHGDVSIAATAGRSASTTMHAGQTLVVTGRDTCDFSWNFESAGASDPNVLTVEARAVPAGGMQGLGWVELTATGRGATRVAVDGICVLPDPLPSEPPGDQLVCPDIAVTFTLNVTVS